MRHWMHEIGMWVAASATSIGMTASGTAAEERPPVGLQLTLSPFVGGAHWSEFEGAAFEGDDPDRFEGAGTLHYGGRAGLAFNPWIGIEGTYGVTPHASGKDDTRVNHGGADVVLSFPVFDRVTPYVTGGWAQLEFDPDQGQIQTLNGWEAGGGVRIGITREMALRFDVRDVIVEDDDHISWRHSILYTAGLHFALGGELPDRDDDGVLDRRDGCPDTPPGATVDATGCPGDEDLDRVFDGIDRCPSTPRGARVDLTGCPLDTDGDGVFDGLDRCPDTPVGTVIDSTGCPVVVDTDSDDDGVPNVTDACPDTPAGTAVDARGCPVVRSEKEVQLLDTGMLRLDNILFDTGKAVLKSASFPVLDEVGALLVAWPQLRVEIGGHTDSTGDAKFNRTLSERRAKAVLDYLQDKFPSIRDTAHTVAGYGETQPVGDNKTRAGRAQNRRVEFKVIDRGTLRKEAE